jgi:hypothetical protein
MTSPRYCYSLKQQERFANPMRLNRTISSFFHQL